jgi:hypothetical protein
MRLHSQDKLQALAANAALEQKLMTVTNTLAYYKSRIITAVKCFKVQADVESAASLTKKMKLISSQS